MDIKWHCYLLMSLTHNRTYIGSTPDMQKRLAAHNMGRGAKYTRGQTWILILVISGFENKSACLSFEAGWKKLSKRRSNKRFNLINFMYQTNLRYRVDSVQCRLLDLIYFVHYFTLLGTHFILNRLMTYPLYLPDLLTIRSIE